MENGQKKDADRTAEQLAAENQIREDLRILTENKPKITDEEKQAIHEQLKPVFEIDDSEENRFDKSEAYVDAIGFIVQTPPVYSCMNCWGVAHNLKLGYFCSEAMDNGVHIRCHLWNICKLHELNTRIYF